MTNINKKISKVLLILLIVQFIFGIGNVSQAGFWDDIISSASNFLEEGENSANKGQVTTQPNEQGNSIIIATPQNSQIKKIIDDIYSILFPLGVAITVIVGGILGIKFMIASAEDKAKVKESLVPYVVGCIVIYGAFGIWKLAITIFSAIG